MNDLPSVPAVNALWLLALGALALACVGWLRRAVRRQADALQQLQQQHQQALQAAHRLAQAEQALQEREQLFEQMSALARIGGWRFDPHTGDGQRTEEVRRIYDADEDVPVHRDRGLAAFTEPHRTRIQQAMALALQEHVPYDMEAEMLSLAGRRKWVRIKGEPVLADGRVVALRGFLQDITERHDRDEALRKLSQAVEQSPSSIVVMDLEGRIEYVNAAFEHTSGFSRQDVLGANPRWQRRQQQAPEQAAELTRTVLDGHTWRGEMAEFRKDGQAYDEWVQVSPVRQPDGRISHVVAISEDITERKRLQAELQRHRTHLEDLVQERTQALQDAVTARTTSEHFLRSIADNLPDMLAYWDADLVCRFSNRGHQLWLGRRDDEVLGHHAREVMGEAVFQQAEPLLRAALAGETIRCERELASAGGHRIQAWVHCLPDRTTDGVRGIFLLVADISEVKRAQQKLQSLNDELVQARDRAESASRAKSAFLANMSHEIRTPLNAVIGMAHLMQREGLPPTQRERLQRVTDAAEHLLGVVSDVLDLSKIEAGKLVLERVAFDPLAAMQRVLGLVRERAAAKGLALSLQADDLPPRVLGDPTRLSQAALNLLSNAIKFTERGSVQLRCGPAAANLLRFEVIDTGVGVPAPVQERLFQSFEQGDASSTRRFGGTGLGLAITRRLAELMGGGVGMVSTPGQGSRFWFTALLPADMTPPDAPAPADEAASPWHLSTQLPLMLQAQGHAIDPGNAGDLAQRLRQRHAGARLLLAEDNAVNRELFRELLVGTGLVLDTVEDGRQALDAFRSESYDLVVLDVQMPVMDGLQACRALRLMPGGRQLPVLAVTADVQMENREACQEAGMNELVAKPLVPALLYAALLRWLPSRQPPQVGAASNTSPVPAQGPAVDLPAVAGLDMAVALGRMGGRQAIYRSVLQRFVGLYGPQGSSPDLQALHGSSTDQLSRALHSIKGAAAAIGAFDLQRCAEELDQASQDGADATQRAAMGLALREQLRGLSTAIQQGLQAPSS